MKIDWPHSLKGFPGDSLVRTSLTIQEIQEMPVPSLGRENPLEEEKATHFIFLAWIIPWTEEPGKLQSRGFQRVGHY